MHQLFVEVIWWAMQGLKEYEVPWERKNVEAYRYTPLQIGLKDLS